MDDFTALKSKIKNIALLPAEKAAILERVAGFVEARPFTASPVGLGYFLGWRFTVPVFLVLFVAVSALTTWAAERALPGDLLYPLKIKLNEGVKGLLVFNPIAKVELEARRAATRLAEAEQLAAKGKLNEVTGREVTARLEQHTSKIKTKVAELKLSGAGEEKAAVEAVARMDNLLEAQQVALTKAAEQDQTVAATVTELVAKAEKIKTDIEQATAGVLPDTRLTDLQSTANLVLARLNELEEFLTSGVTKLDLARAEAAVPELDKVQILLEQAGEKLAAREYPPAILTLKQAAGLVEGLISVSSSSPTSPTPPAAPNEKISI